MQASPEDDRKSYRATLTTGISKGILVGLEPTLETNASGGADYERRNSDTFEDFHMMLLTWLRPNAFDIRTVIYAKHAQHVVLIHFPIALFITAVAFDLIAYWTKRRAFTDAAYYNLLVAALATIPVVVTGIIAWQLQLEGQKLKGNLLLHLLLGSLSA